MRRAVRFVLALAVVLALLALGALRWRGVD